MKKKFVTACFLALALFLASVSPAGVFDFGYGCWMCEYCGGDGLTGPSKICCEDVGHNGNGLGIKCEERSVPGAGQSCHLSGGPCFQCVVWE